MREWLIDNNIADEETLIQIEKDAKKLVKEATKRNLRVDNTATHESRKT